MPRKAADNNPGDVILKFISDVNSASAKLQELVETKDLQQKILGLNPGQLKKGSEDIRHYAENLLHFCEALSPAKLEKVQITLGRSDSIARYFTFLFANRPRMEISKLDANPFYGSGVYAIYYTGNFEPAYEKLRGTETPIYVGKADPKDPYAESTFTQGMALHSRLREHLKSLNSAALNPAAFEYRYATIQSGLQASVEEYLIRLFSPIWNKEVKICFGIGKHGDSAKTRGNKRSPWDTMHPGREWAKHTIEDQNSRYIVEQKIAAHLKAIPPFRNKEELLSRLT